ncbi:microtubule-destabilizing protein 60-like [Nymphaea colorata]|nr:microtubule-destabilizing protein 60-like [Nymphaea colorata]
MMTPSKGRQTSSPHVDRTRRISENSNPNISPGCHFNKSGSSPSVSAKVKPSSTFANALCAASQKIKQRKFVVAKKNAKASVEDTVICECGEKKAVNSKKCRCVAYESLRNSQEEFFRHREIEKEEDAPNDPEKSSIPAAQVENQEQNAENPTQTKEDSPRRLRTEILEQALNSMPEQGSGRVRHLVKAFESLFSFPQHDDAHQEGKKPSKVMKWALPGLLPPGAGEASSSFKPLSVSSSSEFFFNRLNSGTNSILSASVNTSEGSLGSRTSSGSGRSRRNSTDSASRVGGRSWNKQLRVTSQKPFKLRTEQRGKQKQDDFFKRIQDMLVVEASKRIPIAQGLPWTTDEPQCLLKPAVKETTRPLDVKLHSDVRAAERAEFDQAMQEKLSLMEQYKQEQERQQKMAEEEEIKRLRRELIPRAQPMPYFDRPFVPKRSLKHPTIPREPKFHAPHQKKIRCMSWNDINFN